MTETNVSIVSELVSDFLAYSTAIYNRALPSVVDGLKVAQRRVLLGMRDLDLSSNGRYVKVSRLDGTVLSKYHPHGSSASTAITMGQESSMRYTLSAVHGNCGGSIQSGIATGQLISEDPPAAARYLEIKSTPFSESVYLDQVSPGIGKWSPNYDGTCLEPESIVPMLPALLLTGAQGIASGYACHHISYNIRDVINASCAWIKNKKITNSQFLAKFPNPPEPPQGGRIVKNEKISEVIRTGSGQITAYGEWELDDKLKWGKRSTRPALVITRLASGSSEKFLERVRDLADAEKLPGLLDAADHSSRDGIRIVLVTKTLDDRSNVLRVLLGANTGLKHAHNVSCVAVGVNGKPVTIGAKQAIEAWYGERVKHLVSLYSQEIEKLDTRYKRCEAVLKILSDLDKFLKIVRTGKDKDIVVSKVSRTWRLTPELSKYVISIPISTLIATESDKVRLECEELESKISELRPLCSPGYELDEHICSQMASLRHLCGPARAVWMTETIGTLEDLKKPAVTSERDRILEEGKSLGLSTRAVNKWIKENMGTGKLKEKWEEYAEQVRMGTREGKRIRREQLGLIRSDAENKGLPKRGKFSWNSFIKTCESDRLDTICDKMSKWLNNLPSAKSRKSEPVSQTSANGGSRGRKKTGSKQSVRAQGTKRRTSSREQSTGNA